MTVVERIKFWEVIAHAEGVLCHAAPIALDAMHAGGTAAAEAAVIELKTVYQCLTQALTGIDRADPQVRYAQDVMFALKSWA